MYKGCWHLMGGTSWLNYDLQKQMEEKIGWIQDSERFVTVYADINSSVFRYSMVVQDGVVQSVNVEPDGTGLTCSVAEKIQV